MQVEPEYTEIINKNFHTSAEMNLDTKLDERINNIAQKEGYISYNIFKKEISSDGGNYLGVLSEIDIKGNTDNGYKETAIFCKRMNPDPIDMGFVSLTNVYKTELFAYKDLTRTIIDLQEEFNIPINERFNTVKCFDESYEEAIFLDNLTRKGFKTWYRMDIITLEMAEVCVKQLARFHGISFALEQKRPEYFNNNIKNIKTPFIFGKTWIDFVNKFYNIGLEQLDNDKRISLRHKLKTVLEKMDDYHHDYSNAYCLCHGDYRPNNILVKEVDGVVAEAIPVDYQLITYSCPVLDFLYFMYMGTDYEFRKLHMTHLKNLYYESLDKYLKNYDIAVDSVFPRKIFENLYQEKMDFGLITAFLFSPFLFVKEDEEVPDVTKEYVLDIEFKFDDKFKHRLGGAVQEFIDLGYL